MDTIYLGMFTHGGYTITKKTPKLSNISADICNAINVCKYTYAPLTLCVLTTPELKAVQANNLKENIARIVSVADEPVKEVFAYVNKVLPKIGVIYETEIHSFNTFKNRKDGDVDIKITSSLLKASRDIEFGTIDTNCEILDKEYTAQVGDTGSHITVLHEINNKLNIGDDLCKILTGNEFTNKEGTFKYWKLSNIVDYLKNIGYKTVIIIDPSCEAIFDNNPYRHSLRQLILG